MIVEKEPTYKDLKNMKLHEYKLIQDGDIEILRVPHGWIYTYHRLSSKTSTFVPEV